MEWVLPDKLINKIAAYIRPPIPSTVNNAPKILLISIFFDLMKIILNGTIPRYKDEAYNFALCYMISQKSYIIHIFSFGLALGSFNYSAFILIAFSSIPISSTCWFIEALNNSHFSFSSLLYLSNCMDKSLFSSSILVAFFFISPS